MSTARYIAIYKFGLCAELDDAAYDVPARHRVHSAASRWVSGAMLDAAVSIMMMVVGFGAFSSSATKSFCAYGGAGILLGWITQVRAVRQRKHFTEQNLTDSPVKLGERIYVPPRRGRLETAKKQLAPLQNQTPTAWPSSS